MKEMKKTKIIISSLLILTSLSLTGLKPVGGSSNIGVIIDENNIEFTEDLGFPVLKNWRTMVPLRIVSENMGYEVDWSKDTWTSGQQKIFISNGNNKIELEIGRSYAIVNGEKLPIDKRDDGSIVDTKAYVRSSRTYVPIRFISEALGGQVEYERDPSTKKSTIRISTNGLGQDQAISKDAWVEPEFIVRTYEKPYMPISIYVKNHEDFRDKNINISTRLYDHTQYNLMSYGRVLIPGVKNGIPDYLISTEDLYADIRTIGKDPIFDLYIPEDAKYKGKTMERPQPGQTVIVESKLTLDRETRTYKIPVKF